MRNFGLAAVASLVLVSGHSQAATPKKVAKTGVPKPTPVQSLVASIIANVRKPDENLASFCARARPIALFSGLERFVEGMSFSKGEFEATSEFEARKAKLESAIQAFGQITVCQSLNDDDLGFKYDADLGHFKFDSTALQGFSANIYSKKLAPYRAKTRMGIPFTVRPWVEVRWNFSTSGLFDDQCFVGRYIKAIEVPAPVASAPLIKSKGQLAFVGDLEIPFYISEDDDPTPSLDEPEVTSTRTMKVYLRVKRAVVIDGGGNELWSCNAK